VYDLKLIGGAIRLVHCEYRLRVGDIGQLKLGPHILK